MSAHRTGGLFHVHASVRAPRDRVIRYDEDMTTVPGLMTAEEFAQLPDARGGERMELVRGAIVMAPPGNAGHGHRARKVERTIEDFVIRHNLGLTSGEGRYRLSV